MPRSYVARIVTEGRCWLAEGIIWDDRAGEALWVDIHNGDLLRSLDREERLHLDTTVGAVAVAEDGGLLVAGHRRLIAISPDGVVSHGPDLLGTRRDVRLNDGTIDPQGRFVVGTISLGEHKDHEQLLRISPDGTIEVLRTGITLSNGIAFDADGTLHHVDTLTKTVSAFQADGWQTVLDHTAFDATGGYPDGLIIDTDGNFWIALFGAGLVQQFSPSGELLATVTLDTLETTCMGFVPGGLAITTARESAIDANAGAVYLAEVDAVGRPENRWAGSTTRPYWTM